MALINATPPPTLYEYYAPDSSISTGLSANQSYLTLNNKNITIYSGTIHYFRVPPEYWRDRLRKMRAAGLNAIETYIPWNLHEPHEGLFDFGSGGTDHEQFLKVKHFLEMVKEEDLFAIVRPGPYICAEWEFGGFPSWLLQKENIKFRTSDPTYMTYVKRYFNILLPILTVLQFTKGGPIIAMQVENEYGSTEKKGKFVPDRVYLEMLRKLMLDHDIVELLVTSDSPSQHGDSGTLPGKFFQTANFANNPEKEFEVLKRLQPNKPFMAMEFWTGWFDHWGEQHHLRNNNEFYSTLERILTYPASVNMYMFHGGTSWGFLNGANVKNDLVTNTGYQPDTTSYDYDAPLSESGDYTVKYSMVKELIKKYNTIVTRLPNLPPLERKMKYNPIGICGQIPLNDILNHGPAFIPSKDLITMESLPINNGSGQSFGYIVYRKVNLLLPANSILMFKGNLRDSVIVILNGQVLNQPLNVIEDLDKFGYWRQNVSTITLNEQELQDATLDLFVENWGRINFGHLDQYYQTKGLGKDTEVLLNDQHLQDWLIYPMEFTKTWINKLQNWKTPTKSHVLRGPVLYYANFDIDQTFDTFIDMSNATKGIVIINGFVLGRYAKIGPQQTLYLPAPFLHIGRNKIIVFEQFSNLELIQFSATPIFKTRS